MTLPVSSTSSPSTPLSNLDFYLDHFPPPRPSDSTAAVAISTSQLVRSHTQRTRSSSASSMDFAPDPVPAPRPSPKSPIFPNPTTSTWSRPYSPRSLESGVRRFAKPRPSGGLRGTFSKLFKTEPEPELGIPIQDVPDSESRFDVHLDAWRPLQVEKRPVGTQAAECRCSEPKRRKRRLVYIVLVIILLYLFANMIVLNVRIFTPRFSIGNSSRGPQYGTNNDTYTLSAAQELCLTQFTVNAPANASLYPCSTCLPFLQDIPSSFSFSTSDGAQTLSNNLQFCGLQSLLSASDATAQGALINGGWGQDVNFCTWSGVQCDGNGRVESLEMVFPTVPFTIPPGIGALTSMKSLQITGGNAIPAGSLPSSFANLTSLTVLHLESTALSPLPSTLFSKGALDALTTLTLVKNTGFGGMLPDVSGLSLRNFVISEQQISTSFASLLNSTTLQNSLTTLSLTSSNLTGSFPSSPSLNALTTLSLANNSGLTGTVPDSLCHSSVLTSCTLGGTGLKADSSGCEACTF